MQKNTLASSHWGFDDFADEAGHYSPKTDAKKQPDTTAAPAIVLTIAGEVLIHRAPDAVFSVALMIGREHGALSRPQVERMLRVWDIALSLAHGNSEAITLLPVPQQWRFSRTDYLLLDEWQTQSMMPREGGSTVVSLGCAPRIEGSC